MDQQLFKQLLLSMEEMGEISRGEREPSRTFQDSAPVSDLDRDESPA